MYMNWCFSQHYTHSFLNSAWLRGLMFLLLCAFVCVNQGMDEVDVSKLIDDTTVGIYVLREHGSSEPEDIGVVLEGLKALTDLDSILLAVTMMLGLMYALNLRYPPDLRYTFEALQKIFMELDEGKLSNKVALLKNRLFQ